MNVAVICELNPPHNGHAAIFEYARNLGDGGNNVIAVMSGNYCQRGEPAIVDKWSRSRMAVACGADLVIEIPSVFAQQSAQFFADAAVDIVCKTGICDALVFGSETGDIDLLESLAQKRTDDNFRDSFKELIDSGLSYPRALSMFYGCEPGANDILGVEYLVALKKRASSVKPYCMKRIGSSSHDSKVIERGGSIASAASIRNTICSSDGLTETNTSLLSNVMPQDCFDLLNDLVRSGSFVPSVNVYGPLIVGKLRELGVPGIDQLPFASGGLSECIYGAACRTADIDQIIEKATSRSYTSSRIRRVLLSLLTGARMDMISDMINVPYLRVLAVSKGRDDLLSSLSMSNIPLVIGNIPKQYVDLFPRGAARLLTCEILATDFYTLGFKNGNGPAHLELTTPLLKV